MILLGSPKTGTSKLFECVYNELTSPCCNRIKEPFFFLFNKNKAFKKRLRDTSPSRPALDFTPNYLSHAHESVLRMKDLNIPNTNATTFVIIYRDPIARAFSHYCMMSPSPAYLKQQIPRRCTDGHSLCRAFREHVPIGVRYRDDWVRLVTCNATLLAQTFDRMYPWIDQGCRNSNGFGWYNRRSNFSMSLRADFLEFRKKCSFSLAHAKTSTEWSRLECTASLGFNNLFAESVPLFQLRYFQHAFPNVKWIVLNYETLFTPAGMRSALELFGVSHGSRRCKVHARKNSFASEKLALSNDRGVAYVKSWWDAYLEALARTSGIENTS